MKKILLLGHGVVGRSVLKFFNYHRSAVCKFFNTNDFVVCIKDDVINVHDSIKAHDIVIASPGFDLNEYEFFDKKIVCELDLFYFFFKLPTIAVTGTLGKTTVTTLLAELAKAGGMRVAVGGNIGTAMLDLIDHQKNVQEAFLELSSFQLERNKFFIPDVAIWTNFSSNHLDRHVSIKNYCDAKWKLFEYQKKGQAALFSLQLYPMFKDRIQKLKSRICFVADQESDLLDCEDISYDLYDVVDKKLRERKIKKNKIIEEKIIFDLSGLPDITFLQNWLLSLVALHVSKISCFSKKFKKNLKNICVPEHRLEQCATIRGATFYNDSKSTVMQATYAAVQKLSEQGRPVRVIVGGLSKGVDRSCFIQSLHAIPHVVQVACFGAECCMLGACQQHHSLQAVIQNIFNCMQPGDSILFSPGGSSFDLFDNYQHRGDVFKDLVLNYAREV